MDFDRSDPLDGQNRGLIPASPPPSTPVAARLQSPTRHHAWPIITPRRPHFEGRPTLPFSFFWQLPRP